MNVKMQLVKLIGKEHLILKTQICKTQRAIFKFEHDQPKRFFLTGKGQPYYIKKVYLDAL